MNLRGGAALMRKSILSFTAMRGFFWTLALGWMMMPLIYMLVWIVAAGDSAIGGFRTEDFIRYYVVLIIVNQLTYPVSHWVVGDQIFSGQFSLWLLRPLPPVYEAVAGDLAVKAVCLPFVAIFAVVLMGIFDFTAAFAWNSLPFVLLSVLASQLLRFMLAYCLSLLALLVHKISSLLQISDTLLMLFGGQLVPTVLLPGAMQQLAFFLPFRYMLGFPIEILLGKTSGQQMLYGFGMQLFWLAAVLLLHRVIWKKGIQTYSSVGG